MCIYIYILMKDPTALYRVLVNATNVFVVKKKPD